LHTSRLNLVITFLTLRADLVEAMKEHARRDHPIEACGIIAGHTVPQRHIPMRNAENSPAFFRFDRQQQADVWWQMHELGEKPLVIYHSHTSSDATMSRSDIDYARVPGAHHVVMSTRDPQHTEIRAYWIEGRRAIPVPLTVVNDYADQG
jgi:[CysO sulfur-carrier protein]-S-L-cysteine hydrolase